MSGKMMVAYNPVSKLYLRKKKKMWFTTDNPAYASACPESQLRQALLSVGQSSEGGWMLMKQGDVAKIANVQQSTKSLPVVVKTPVVRKKTITSRKTPQSPGCIALLDAMKAVEMLVSQDKVDELCRRQSEADKTVCDIYHFIETSNLNASQGYKAYKRLQTALIERRKIKNEQAMVNEIRKKDIFNSDYYAAIAQRSYDPQVDVLIMEG